MNQHNHDRRLLLKLVSGAALAAAFSFRVVAQEVPWSSGTEQPKTRAPAKATDCHHHIYDKRFPTDPRATLPAEDATVADYRKLQQRIGTSRNVVVQPSAYGTDNRGLTDALSQFGSAARGVAVVNTSVRDPELRQLNEAGVRGIRFNLKFPAGPNADMLEPLAQRINALGWHIQINASADQIVSIEAILNRLPTPIVFDHLAQIPQQAGINDPSFGVVAKLIDKGRTWIKLTGPYITSKVGPPTYADAGAVAKAFVQLAPERMVWGSDWPHPSEKVKPDDALLFDLLAEWAPDERARDRILVDNPATLYGF
jgi:predicted TIM-barrel fold metal-dependent hydrolase